MATRWKSNLEGGQWSAVRCSASGGGVQSAQTDQRCTMGDSSLNQTSWSSLSLSLSPSLSVSVWSLSPRVWAQMAWLLLHGLRSSSLTWYGCSRIPKSLPPPSPPYPMNGEIQPLLADEEPRLKFERWAVEGEDFRSIAHQYEESIYVIHLQLVKKIQQITTACNRLDLKHSGSSVFTDRHRSKNLLGQLTFSTFDPFCTLTVYLTQLECNVQTLFGKNGSKFLVVSSPTGYSRCCCDLYYCEVCSVDSSKMMGNSPVLSRQPQPVIS